MLRIIVTVKRQDEETDYDLEVPAGTPVSDLSQFIAMALGWPNKSTGSAMSYSVYTSPPKRYIPPNESLADAGVWDGALLIFQLSQKTQQFKRTSSVSSIILQSDSGKRYIISSSPSTLGRRTLSTSAIANLIDFGNEVSGKSVSRRHAKLEWIENQWRITPLHGVNNRTLINGAQVMPKEFNILQKNDKLTLGKLKLRVVSIDQHPKDEDDINHGINTEFYDREDIT